MRRQLPNILESSMLNRLSSYTFATLLSCMLIAGQASGQQPGATEIRQGVIEQRLLATENAAVYARASGQLLFEREGALMAQRFDSDRLELTGEAFRVADNIPSGAPPLYSASANGVLAYATGAV